MVIRDFVKSALDFELLLFLFTFIHEMFECKNVLRC